MEIATLDARSNSLLGSIPVLAQILEHDSRIERAYLCTQPAIHVWKSRFEGNNFCGYHCIQMLVDDFRSSSMEEIQVGIEAAWNAGFNAHARKEIGSLKGTKKQIGSSEVEALLLSLNVKCRGDVFKGKKAMDELFESVEAYFHHDTRGSYSTMINRTALPPIFLQMPKHSVVVVGYEKRLNGSRRLLVFDPDLKPPQAVIDAECPLRSPRHPWRFMWKYRRNESYLKRQSGFETVRILS